MFHYVDITNSRVIAHITDGIVPWVIFACVIDASASPALVGYARFIPNMFAHFLLDALSG
jgi:hypothetical protein